VVCAGEPGASVPATKERIEDGWDAAVFDHAGATEAGAWGYSAESTDELGLYLNEAFFLVEVLDDDGEPVDPGEIGEVVVTPLDREGQPYLRFALRDQVRLAESPDGERTFRFAEGGVLGRTDDLTKINGVLFSPTSVEDVVRRYERVSDEFRVVIDDHESKDIDVVALIAERAPGSDVDDDEIVDALDKELKQATNLTFRIELRPFETLDRFELKADRVTDKRDHR